MEENEMVDQSLLAQDVAEHIKFVFIDYFLVKPLDPVKILKEFSVPVANGDAASDENGIEAKDFDEVKTEVKEVNSDYRKGIVIKRPMYYDDHDENTRLPNINVGDVVVFREPAGLRFDMVKDSRLLRQYDILGVECK